MMQKTLSSIILATSLLIGCDSGEEYVTKDQACSEQAELWCERLGYPTNGCHTVYYQWCTPDGELDTLVSVEDQNACLTALDVNKTPDCVPDACLAIWAE